MLAFLNFSLNLDSITASLSEKGPGVAALIGGGIFLLMLFGSGSGKSGGSSGGGRSSGGNSGGGSSGGGGPQE